MHRFVRFVFTVTLLLFPTLVFAQVNCDNLHDVVESYLKARHPAPTKPIRVAVYDTKDRSWHAYRWYENDLDETKAAIEVAFNNDPTLLVRRGEEVVVLIARADPLHYTTEVTSMTRADIEGLAALQQLAKTFGGSITTIAPGTTLAQPQGGVTAGAVEEFHAYRDSQRESRLSEKAAKEAIRSAPRKLKPLVEKFINELAPHHNALQQVLSQEQDPIESAGELVLKVDDIRADTAEALQSAELGTHSPLKPAIVTALPTLRTDALREFNAAVTAGGALASTKPVCTASVAALDDVMRLIVDGTPVDPDEADDVRQLLRAAYRKLRPSALSEDCSAQAPTAALHLAISDLVDWLRDPENRAAVAADDNVDELLVQARELGSSKYMEAVVKRADLLATVKEVQEKRAATLRVATQLQQFGELYNAQVIANSNCWMSAGVVEVDRIQQPEGFKLPWYQVQTEEFAMTVRPMFEDDVVRRLPDVKGKYTFARNIEFGVDTALIYTKAHDREYKAVEKAFKDENSDGLVNDADKGIYPTETSRTDRTGKLALMLTASPGWAKGFGAQLGFGVDTDNPAAYIGLTRSLGRFARISAGHTQQRVTRLGRGQSLDAKIPTADDLRTRKAFDASWYVALAFTISELPIFKAD